MKFVVVGTAGHIDHGKSALVQALTGTDPDRLKEEKARGITIDLGFAHAQFEDVNFAFIDVPGHERFVKNMLAGVGGIDLVLLVVAADESVMPQTREHFDICQLLRIPAGIVALTKWDLVDSDTLEMTRLEVGELVAGSFFESASVVAVSSKTGEGLDRLRAALVAAAAAKGRGRTLEGPTRLPIDRVFSMKGFGTVITGTLVSGRVRPDDRLLVVPDASVGRGVSVRGVQVHGTRKAEAVAGERVAVNLGGVDVGDFERGQVLVSPGAFEVTRAADASLETLASAGPLRHGARVRFHQGTAEVIGRVSIIGPAEGGTQLAVGPGQRVYVRLRLERPAILARGDRYILRAYSPPLTIAGGEILDPAPPRAAIRTTTAIDRCRKLGAHPAGSIEAELAAVVVMVEEAGSKGLPMSALISRSGINGRDIDPRVAELVQAHGVRRAADVLVSATILDRLKTSIVDLLARHHVAQPLSQGMPREEARERLFRHGHPAVFERAVHDLADAGVVIARDRLMLATYRIRLSPEEERARDGIENTLRAAGLTPPDVAALASRVGMTASVADRVLKLLQRQERVVKVDTLFFHHEALKALKDQVVAIGKSGTRIDVASFKERFGVTREFAIPLLEYLDRERVTRRVGDSRLVL